MSDVIARILVKFALPKPPDKALVAGRAVWTATNGNVSFPGSATLLGQINTGLESLQTLNASCKNKLPGASASRRALLKIMTGQFAALKGQIQQVADNAGDQATVVIQSSGMGIRKIAVRPAKAPLTAKWGPVSGEVLLIAKAIANSAYLWQWSSDGKNWSAGIITRKARALITALTPGTLYYFRVQITTRTGTLDWSQSVTLLVK